MPIKNLKFGEHSNVLHLEFGTGDITFTRAREKEENSESLMIFHQNNEGHKVGEESSRFVGKSSDEIPDIKLVMKFKRVESITALVHSLLELQECMMGLRVSSDVVTSKLNDE
jgi:hypothetical protein